MRGFTIIEVLLFVTISGGLMAALLIGTGISIQQQEYRDMVQSFANFLQGQYSAVINVENNTEHRQECPMKGAPSGGQFRGQSECFIIGRYIESRDGEGREYVSYPLYARKNGTDAATRKTIWQYEYSDTNDTEKVSHTIGWSGRTKFFENNSGSTTVSIVMYRHPETGQIYIKADKSHYAKGDIKALMGPGAMDASEYEICVYDNGWLQHERQSVFINGRAGSADAIRIDPAQTGGCLNA